MRRAIALGGGGTKGSYELGVWKALMEMGINYDIVTGTSIGAINGAMMTTQEYERACELWDTIEMEDVMSDGVNLIASIEGMYNQREAIRPFLKKYVKNKGADISPFIQFIDRHINEDKVRNSNIDYGLVTVQFPSLKGQELTKEEIPYGMLKDYIMASAAIFPVFPMQKIGGETYLDGCYYDDLPIDLALKMGADEVIAVDLHSNPHHPNYVNKPYITYITPSKSLGTMLNFDRSILNRNRATGYYDTMKAFGRMAGYEYIFYQCDLDQYQREILAFVSRVARTEAYLTEGVFSKFMKPGDSKRLCGNIEEHIKKKRYTRQDYFVGAAEICGEIFGLPKEKPWHLWEYTENLLASLISKEKIDFSMYEGLGPVELASKLTEMKLKRDSKYITSSIYHAYRKGKVDLTEQQGLIAFVPYELAAALFLLTMD